MSRRFFKTKKKVEKPRFELTPLIDIIFILVLFFAITSSFVDQKQGLTLTLPSAVSTEVAKKSIIISVDQYQRVHWNGVQISEDAIADKIIEALEISSEQQFVLQADKNTPYVRVVSILDTIRTSGCTNVMLEAEKS